MHTSKTMFTAEFAFGIDGGPATFDDVFPDFTVDDRLAIVTTSPGGAFAAAPLLLASIGRYYELLRQKRSDFYRYPGYYVVHAGRRYGHHAWIDIWPANKEVVVAAEGEAVLEALYDRAITHVMLEDCGSAPGELMREHANWLLEDVREVLTYTAGASAGPITVRPSAIAADFIGRAAESGLGMLDSDLIQRINETSSQSQGYTRISSTDALRRICAYGPNSGVIGQDAEYLKLSGASASVMEPHRFVVE